MEYKGPEPGHKQKELKKFLAKNKIEVFGCLEMRVKESRAQKILQNVAKGWKVCYNYTGAHNGRIWLIWSLISVFALVDIKEQFLHCLVEDLGTQITVYLIVVYAWNECKFKEMLWNELTQVDLALVIMWRL